MEIIIEMKSGREIYYCGCGSCGDGFANDFCTLTATVGPCQLGTAESIQQLVQLLKDGIVDVVSGLATIRIFDASDAHTKARVEGEIAGVGEAYRAYIFEKYASAAEFVEQIERIEDINLIKNLTIHGREQGRGFELYDCEYAYDRERDVHTARKCGRQFETDGGRGGEIMFSDESIAVDPRKLETFHFSEFVNILNYHNRFFVTTGFNAGENNFLETAIRQRGGIISSTVNTSAPPFPVRTSKQPVPR